jgi:hypothetical protein
MLAIAAGGSELGGVADADGRCSCRGSSGLTASHGSAVARCGKTAVGGVLRLDRKYSTRLLASGDCQLSSHARRSSCSCPYKCWKRQTGLRDRCSQYNNYFGVGRL